MSDICKTITAEHPELALCLKKAKTWKRRYSGLTAHLRSKGYHLTRGAKKRLKAAFETSRRKRTDKYRQRVHERYSGARIAEIEQELKTEPSAEIRRYMERLLTKKRLNDKSEKKKRAEEYFDDCLDLAKKWTSSYDSLTTTLNCQGYLFSKAQKHQLRRACEKHDKI